MKKRILIIAYACEPNKGSEPEVGWKSSIYLTKELPNSKFTIITKSNNKGSIESEGYPPNIEFIYHSVPKALSFWKRGQRGVRTYYYLWMLTGALKLKFSKESFDIVHHITFVNDWLPSIFILLKNHKNKFIWGSIGSHDFIEFRFLKTTTQKVIESIRRSLQIFFRNFDPFFYLCKIKSDCIVGINYNVKNKLKLKNKCFIAEPAIGMDRNFIDRVSCKESDDFIVVSVGRLIYIKNFEMSIRAFSKFVKENNLKRTKLKIIGDGNDKEYLKKLTKDLEIDNQIIFTGKISLNQVYEEFSKASVFIFPTFENAGFVFLEAMAHCLPIVGLNYGGASQFILSNRDKQLVDIDNSYDIIINKLSLKLENFYKNKEDRKSVGKNNREDVLNNFTWNKKAEKFIKIYKGVLNEN